MRLLRQSTVEPIFGSLLQRQVNTCGRASAHKMILLATLAYNLKKLLQYRTNQRLGLVIALPQPLSLPSVGLLRGRNRGHRLLNPLSSKQGI